MSGSTHGEWTPVRLYGGGLQPHTARAWNCLPAWDVVAVHEKADAVLHHPDHFKAQAGAPDEECPDRDKVKHVFRDRHIDKRFYLDYPNARKGSPRARGVAIGDSDAEWDTLIEWRNRYLAEAGLDLKSDPEAVAKRLAETFAADGHFKDKPMCDAVPDNHRALNGGIEGLLYKSHCVGCAKAYVLLADSLGLPCRNMGCGGHWVAEVFVGGKWHLVDSVGRHERNRGLDCYFKSSFLESYLDPMGDHGEDLSDDFRKGLWKRENPQFHFTGGMWAGPQTLRYAGSNAYALYPDETRWGIKSDDGKRVPVVLRAGGFYWPTAHNTIDGEELERVRRSGFPRPMSHETPGRDYFYQPFETRQKLRQSVVLGSLDDAEAVEATFTFAPSKVSDFSPDAGKRLVVKVGAFEKSLADLGAWPPALPDDSTIEEPSSGECLRSTASLPVDAFRPESVNWIELHHRGRLCYFAPMVPAVMEPYIAPLWRRASS